ncbi:MAG: Gfo/Idh/MocA family oxidoreductase [Acetivibrionales bacterium]
MRWGLIGSGTIGAQFARDISVLPDSKIIAVYSRSKTKAEAFATEI